MATPVITTDPLAGRSVVSVRLAADALAVSTTTIRRLLDCGKLDQVRIGKCLRIPVASIRALTMPKASKQAG